MEGPWVPLQEFFVFSMFRFKGTLEVSLQETTASSHSSTPDTFSPSPPPSPAAPQALQLDKQPLQSLTTLQCTERSFLSSPWWADGRAAARVPAPASPRSQRDQPRNTQHLEVLITTMGSLPCSAEEFGDLEALGLSAGWALLWNGLGDVQSSFYHFSVDSSFLC